MYLYHRFNANIVAAKFKYIHRQPKTACKMHQMSIYIKLAPFHCDFSRAAALNEKHCSCIYIYIYIYIYILYLRLETISQLTNI